ncbi:hypothetical protein [Cyanobacterium sp. Dongsha4]|nr:hypothetical protein [Cyanobacterium sp. Dongsha4]WVL00137.1 hypothetical protein Dongsha4_15995 [Cyanobacterium sp. Dongsha4]
MLVIERSRDAHASRASAPYFYDFSYIELRCCWGGAITFGGAARSLLL